MASIYTPEIIVLKMNDNEKLVETIITVDYTLNTFRFLIPILGSQEI